MRGADQIRRFATLGNHLPRQCGIATFATHLTDALVEQLPDANGFVIAMNDAGHRHAYPSRVRFEIGEGDLSSYQRAADYLNVNQVDVLSVQHEYGIFGGKAGAHLLELLRALRSRLHLAIHHFASPLTPQPRSTLHGTSLKMSDRDICSDRRRQHYRSMVSGGFRGSESSARNFHTLLQKVQ
jgi:hypothetical protein